MRSMTAVQSATRNSHPLCRPHKPPHYRRVICSKRYMAALSAATHEPWPRCHLQQTTHDRFLIRSKRSMTAYASATHDPWHARHPQQARVGGLVWFGPIRCISSGSFGPTSFGPCNRFVLVQDIGPFVRSRGPLSTTLERCAPALPGIRCNFARAVPTKMRTCRRIVIDILVMCVPVMRPEPLYGPRTRACQDLCES